MFFLGYMVWGLVLFFYLEGVKLCIYVFTATKYTFVYLLNVIIYLLIIVITYQIYLLSFDSSMCHTIPPQNHKLLWCILSHLPC